MLLSLQRNKHTFQNISVRALFLHQSMPRSSKWHIRPRIAVPELTQSKLRPPRFCDQVHGLRHPVVSAHMLHLQGGCVHGQLHTYIHLKVFACAKVSLIRVEPVGVGRDAGDLASRAAGHASIKAEMENDLERVKWFSQS